MGSSPTITGSLRTIIHRCRCWRAVWTHFRRWSRWPAPGRVPPSPAGRGRREGGRAEKRGRARIRELTGGVIAVSGGGGGGDGLLWWVASTAGGGRRRAGVSLGALRARRGSGLGSAVLRALGGLRAGRRVSERGDPESTGERGRAGESSEESASVAGTPAIVAERLGSSGTLTLERRSGGCRHAGGRWSG